METIDCMSTRRSVRAYTDEPVPWEVLERLTNLGVRAATGSGLEPWGFVVIQNRQEIDSRSERIKAYSLAHIEWYPHLWNAVKWLENPKSNVFHHAGTLLILYGDTRSHWYLHDGCLAAGQIMLAAHDMGLGTCWIGYGEHVLNTPEFKARYGVPEEYSLVCPLSIGYPKTQAPPRQRKPPVIFYPPNRSDSEPV